MTGRHTKVNKSKNKNITKKFRQDEGAYKYTEN